MNALDRQDERMAIYTRDHGLCQTCGKRLHWGEFELAHRIADTIALRRRYGDMIIDHPLNRRVTCRGRCNDSQNIGGNPGRCAELVAQIKLVSNQKE